MRERIEIIKDIALFNGNLNELYKELSQYPWDIEEPIFQITNLNVLKILNDAISEQISQEDLEDWANQIECRDDFSFENEDLQEVIFHLANPLLYGGLTNELIKQQIDKLQL